MADTIQDDPYFYFLGNYSVQDYEKKRGYFIMELYLDIEVDQEQLINEIKNRYEGFYDFEVDVQKPEDWIKKWKERLKPMWLADDILIDPAVEIEKEVKIIKIVPGMAFGTGNHETTRLAAALLNKYASDGKKVLDVGCGSGILSILARYRGCDVTSVDLDPLAIKATKENLIRNNIETDVEVFKSDLLEVVTKKYDIVVVNMLFDILTGLFEGEKTIHDVIRKDSTIIYSGLIENQYEEFKGWIERAGLHIEEKMSEGDWFSIAVKKQK
jgi:ribosomal protein L11 methyltransferase